LTYVAEIESNRQKLKMDHLVCFAGGMFSLGAMGESRQRDFHTGEEITRTCYEMYHRMATGIAPEISIFDSGDLEADPRAKHYLLRPETVESLFVLYRLTGDQKYRDWGWEIFLAIEKYSLSLSLPIFPSHLTLIRLYLGIAALRMGTQESVTSP
jgi:mannosyl-oligosaccharide alpha-1,2-mannosidase